MRLCEQCGVGELKGQAKRFCSYACSGANQQGKKMPHSLEWEAKRLAAIKIWAANKEWPTGWKHTDAAKKKMSEAAKKSKSEKPHLVAVAIGNLPKACSGRLNGNWRGGVTKETRDYRTQNSRRFSEWRAKIIARDECCQGCGATEQLEAHHIISLKEDVSKAFDISNGLCLCKPCHKLTDTYAGKNNKKVYQCVSA